MERFFGKICSCSIMCRKARINVTKCPVKSLLKSPLETLGCTVSLCVSLSSRVTSTLDDLYMLYFSSQVLVKWARRSQWTPLDDYQSRLASNGSFPDYLLASFSRRVLVLIFSYENWFCVCVGMKTDFLMKGWVPGLALEERLEVIRKWPIGHVSIHIHTNLTSLFVVLLLRHVTSYVKRFALWELTLWGGIILH